MSNDELGGMHPPIILRPDCLKLENEQVAKAVNAYIRQDFVKMDLAVLTQLESDYPRLSHIIKERRIEKNYVANMRVYCRKFAAASLNPDPDERAFQETFDNYAYEVWYPFYATLGEKMVAESRKSKVDLLELVGSMQKMDGILSNILPTKKSALDFHFKQDDFFVKQTEYHRKRDARSPYALSDAECLAFRRAVFSFRADEWNRRYK